MSFAVRLLVNAAALWVATQIVPGVTYIGGLVPFLCVALVFGVINATLRPLTKILTFPLIIVTLVARRPSKVEALPTPTLGDAT